MRNQGYGLLLATCKFDTSSITKQSVFYIYKAKNKTKCGTYLYKWSGIKGLYNGHCGPSLCKVSHWTYRGTPPWASQISHHWEGKIFRQSRTQGGGERLSTDTVHDDDEGHDHIAIVTRPDDQAEDIITQQNCAVCLLPRYLCCHLPIAISDPAMPAPEAAVDSKFRCHDTDFRTPYENLGFVAVLDHRSPSHRKNLCSRTWFWSVISSESIPLFMHAQDLQQYM